jgi:hypothetical protein
LEKTEDQVPDLIASPIQVLFSDDAGEPIANRDCTIIFRDNQEITRTTNAEGILRFIKLTEEEFTLRLHEET